MINLAPSLSKHPTETPYEWPNSYFAGHDTITYIRKFSDSGSETIHADCPIEHLALGQYDGSICGKPAYIFIFPYDANTYCGAAVMVDAKDMEHVRGVYLNEIKRAEGIAEDGDYDAEEYNPDDHDYDDDDDEYNPEDEEDDDE